jgi:hypothetical protein
LLPAAAAAQPEQPTEHDPREAEAQALCLMAEVDRGLSLLTKMYLETLDPLHVFNQARCLQQNGRTEAAIGRFREYLRLERSEESEARADAERHIRELEAGRAVLPPGRSPEAVRAPPSKQGLGPGGLASPDLRPPEDAASRRPALRTAAAIGGLTGALLMGAGVVLSLHVQSLEKEAEALARNENIVDPAQRLRGRRAQTWQWVGYAGGSLALGGAAVAYLFSRNGRGTDRPGASAEAGVLLRASTAGALLRVQF